MVQLDKNSISKILIVKLGSIGDVVHSLPLLNSLRRHLPNARLYWVVEPPAAALLINHKALDKLFIFSRDKSSLFLSFKSFMSVIKNIRAEKINVTIELQGNIKGAIISKLSGANMRIGFTKDSSRVESLSTLFNNVKISDLDKAHIIDKNLNLLKPFEIPADKVEFNIPIDKKENIYVEEFLAENLAKNNKKIIIHPGVSWETKKWPLKYYIELIAGLKKKFSDISIVLTHNKDEESLIEKIVSVLKKDIIVFPPSPLSIIIALLNKAEIFISSDTGLLHISAALDKKVIGLYGPTGTARNGPWGDKSIGIQAETECAGCWERKCPDIKCMRSITVEKVFNEVVKFLN
jgi:lipopolysaccharide heptosyltransferase I